MRALHLPRDDLPERPRSHQVTAAEVVECSRFEASLRINGAAERAVRYQCFEIVPGTAPGKVASAEGTPVELDRRLPIRRRQIGRESEIASAGGVYPPAMAKRIVPAAVVQPRELRSRRGLESGGHARARARKVRQRWEGFSVFCTRILLTGIRGRTLETRFPGSSATTTVRRRRPPSGSISSRVSFWAVFPGAWAAVVPRGTRARVCCHVGQGRSGLGLRARAPGR